MGNLIDGYVAGFLGNLVYREAKKKFGYDGVETLTTINDCKSTLGAQTFSEYEDYYLKNGVMKNNKLLTNWGCWLYVSTPWWAEIKGSDGNAERCVLILQSNDKFYPLFNAFDYSMWYITRKKISDKDKMGTYATLGEILKDKKQRIISMGQGEERTIKGKTYTDRIQTGSKTVSTPTGNYTLTPSGGYFNSNTYSLKQEVTTKTVNTYENVTHSTPDKQALDFCFWFTPETEKEKQRFLKIVENQEKIIQLADEYKRLGIFSGKRKKEIIQTVNNMFEYAYLVVGQASYDRNKTVCDKDMKLLNELIEFANKNINELDEDLKGIAITAFEMRKKYKEPRKEWSKFLSELEKVKNILPQKKELLISTLAGLDKRIDNHPAGCGSSNE